MNSRVDRAYEATRRRHVTYMDELAPEYLRRLLWSREKIEAEQTRALRELLNHAFKYSRWHRERLSGINFEQVKPVDLSAIPPMTKEDLMQHWDSIVADPRCSLAAAENHLAKLTGDAYFLGDLHVLASGGSSGRRGVFVYDWHGWASCWLGLMRGAFAALSRHHPVPRGPIALVTAYIATHATSALPETFSDRDRPSVRVPVTLPLTEIVAKLNRNRPSILVSYASMLPNLCEEARTKRLRIAPTLILSTAEPLLAEVRKAAESTWGVPVLNAWATSESIAGAFPCHIGPGFHIGEDLNIIEPVDDQGKPVPRGTASEKILLTNLYNRVMPLIRYEISDEFQIADVPCSCGAAYLKVDDVQGRADDCFDYPNKIRVHPLNFRTVLGNEPSIVEYRVNQSQRGAEVEIVARGDPSLDVIKSLLEERLTNLGLSSPEVVIRRVERIERQDSGKLKRFVPLARSVETVAAVD
jgi:phenylacetate-CoA ligase